MKTSTDPRHRQRIRVFQHLYSSEVQHVAAPEVAHIWPKLKKIDPVIQSAAPEWPLDKLNPVDLAILRLAVFELVVDKKAPYKVIIDEAVEIAKEFGSEKSPGFVNGALGTIVKTLKLDEDTLVKPPSDTLH